jgi:predicted O-methyltransferase YrrM
MNTDLARFRTNSFVEPVALTKRALRPLLSGKVIGMIDYFRSPELGTEWGPFNGQTARQALFVAIIASTQPQAIVETGTSLGATTELMSQTGLPIFSIELYPRHYGFARARFWRKRNIKVLHGDSRTILRGLLDGPLHVLSNRTIFFYLDAHGHVYDDDLPLAEELDLIFNRCPFSVVMIDDFEVPSDAGYGYDDYGPRKALVLDYIKPAVSVHRLKAFYPSTPYTEDYPSTPMAAAGYAVPGRLRRGCIVLVKDICHEPVLAAIPLLRPITESELISDQNCSTVPNHRDGPARLVEELNRP